MKAVRAVRAVVASLVLGGSLILAGPVAPSSAHAELISSTPADGATLAAVPASVSLTFTDEIDPQFVRAAVTTPAGNGPAQASTDKQTVTIPITSVGPGAYKVLYRVVSADGHPISGSLRFTVSWTQTAVPTSTEDPAASLGSGADAVTTATPGSTAPASSAGSASGTSWVLWGAVGLAVLAGVGAVFAAVRGRKS